VTSTLRTVIVLAVAAASLLECFPAAAQFFDGFGQRGRRGGRFQDFPDPPRVNEFPADKFTFCTLVYDNNGHDEDLGYGWMSEYPDGGLNFMTRLSQLTNIEINREQDGSPHQVILRADDPALFNYPIVFMTDVGTAQFSKKEAENLRNYLLNGGFLMADDFWGETAWEYWTYHFGQVLPPDEYPIRDVPLSHEIFNIVFEIPEMPQVPCVEWWSEHPNGPTSERGAATATPSMRGIWDKNGRLMVVMTHNTDIQDGWQMEGMNEDYFREFSVKKSYPLGINIVVYAMTH
jgi:hypothetical protein